MKHAEHGAKAKGRFNSPFMLFTSVRGSHASSSNRHAFSSNNSAAVLANNGAVVSLENVDLENVNQEFAVSLSRRQLRLARVAKERKNRMIVSASLFALVGAALTSMTSVSYTHLTLPTTPYV